MKTRKHPILVIIKQLLVGIFIAILPFLNWAQNHETDSLKSILPTLNKDTNRVNLLLDLSNRVFRSLPDEAIDYSNEAIDLSVRLGFQKGEAYALKNKGLAYFVKGDYTKVLEYWEQSLAVFESMGDQLGVSNLLNNLGAVYFNQGDDPKALELYLTSLRVSEELGNDLRIATASTNIGAVYFNNPVNHDKARKYYLRALAISERIGDPAAIGTSIVNLGETYIEKGDLDSARYFFHKALKADEDARATTAYIYNNLAQVEALEGHVKKALEFHETAYQEALKVKAKLDIVQSMNGLGNAYLELGRKENRQEDLSNALKFFQEALREAKLNDLKPEIQKAAKGLYELYKMQKNYPLALQYHETYEAVKDTLLNEENINLLAVLGAEHEFEKEKTALDAEIKRQRELQLATAAGLLISLILIIILVLYYRLLRVRASERFEAQRQLIMQDKLASLGQITAGIAHEIKNPLNFVTNFAEGSIEFGEELIEVIVENEKRLPTDEYELIKELTTDINENSRIIQENGLRADRVVKRMMEQARGDKGEPQKVDINTLIDENLLLAYHGYRANNPGQDVRLEKDYDPGLPMVKLIPQDIGRVILNIFNNACFAMDEKRSKANKGFQPTFSVATSYQNQQAVIRLRDNGLGIPEKIKEKIFRPFFTTKPTGQGNTGLGLSISHDLIVIGHHGELEVNSEIGAYTEFIIRLPVEHAAQVLSAAENRKNI